MGVVATMGRPRFSTNGRICSRSLRRPFEATFRPGRPMYIPRHFAVSDRDEMFAFIEANAFGQLISSVAGRPFSTHMPFLLSADRTPEFDS